MSFLVFNHGLPQARDPTVPGRSKGNALPDTGVSARLAHREERAPNGLVITGADRFDRVGRANDEVGLGVVLRGMAGACAHDDFDSCTIVELGRRLTGGAHLCLWPRRSDGAEQTGLEGPYDRVVMPPAGISGGCYGSGTTHCRRPSAAQ